MRRVLYVAKTHLDVGFTDLASAVRRRYLEEFFPRALTIAEQLRAVGGPARLRWTTGSWILSEALDAADATGRKRLERAIVAGDLCWHALPFTLHTEYAERSLVEHGLSLSAALDRRFGRRTRAAKVTDVPGHSRGIVPLLAAAGVDFLHVGVNPASSAPRVPQQFRWRDASSDTELAVMYQPGGYGALQRIEGTDVAVLVDLTGDNLGPRDAQDLTARFEALAAQHPGAEVTAATLDDVAAVVATTAEQLPVLHAEIGDSWIHGVGSDPVKTAGFRALCRLRRSWLDDGVVAVDDPALSAASTSLLLVAEHTWGLDQKTHWPDQEHWSAQQLALVRDLPATRRFEQSWHEQRGYLDRFVEQLRAGGRPELARAAAQVLAESRRPLAELGALQPVAAGRDVASSAPDQRTSGTTILQLGALELHVDERDGAVVGLIDDTGRQWVSPTAPLGRFRIRTLDSDDYERWFRTYNAPTVTEDLQWARWDNTKPGLEHSGALSATWSPRLVSARVVRLGGVDCAAIELDGPTLDGAVPEGAVSEGAVSEGAVSDGAESDRSGVPLDAPVAWPERVVVLIGTEGPTVSMQLCWSAMPAARWPQVVSWSISPRVARPDAWVMRKLGQQVAPHDVVPPGVALHVADCLEHPDGVRVELLDSGLVCAGDPAPLQWPPPSPQPERGWHLWAHANLWGTNFPMWSPGDARFRVRVELPSPTAS